MFYGCKKLNSIKLAYTGFFDVFPGEPTFDDWVVNVHKNGTIYYNGEDKTRGIDAIPEG